MREQVAAYSPGSAWRAPGFPVVIRHVRPGEPMDPDRSDISVLPVPRCSPIAGITQPFAYLASILSRWLANDCRSLLLNAGGPPVCIPLPRNVSMKSRMLSRWRMVSVE